MYRTIKSIALLGLCAIALTVSGNAVTAATFEIVGGAPLSAGPTPFYGSALPQNNVVNSPGASPTGAAVVDPTGPNLTPDTPWVQGGQLVVHTGSSSLQALAGFSLDLNPVFKLLFIRRHWLISPRVIRTIVPIVEVPPSLLGFSALN